MKLQTRQSSLAFRTTARLMAVFFLWMGLCGVLLHSDDFQMAHASSSPAAWQHSASAVPADHDCAACQWTQGLQIGAPIVLALVTTTQAFVFPINDSPRFFVRPLIGLSQLRAPPVF